MASTLARVNGDLLLELSPTQVLTYLKDNLRLVFNSSSAPWRQTEHDQLFHRYLRNNPQTTPTGVITDVAAIREVCDLLEKSERPLTFLDVGCGRGHLLHLITKYTDYQAGKDYVYIGLDIESHPEWQEVPGSVHFFRGNAEELDCIEFPRPIDVVFSLSTLEHIHNDIVAFQKQQLLASKKRSVHLVHIVPCKYSFFMFLLHGWRVYTAHMVSQLVQDNSAFEVEVWEYGGPAKLLLHVLAITLPEQVLSSATRRLVGRRIAFRGGRIYERLLQWAFNVDKAAAGLMPLRFSSTMLIRGKISLS